MRNIALALVSLILTACGQSVPTSQVLNPPTGSIIKAGDRLYNVGSDGIKEVGATASPSSSSFKLDSVSLSADGNRLYGSFEGSGYSSVDIYVNDSLKVDRRTDGSKSFEFKDNAYNTGYKVKVVLRDAQGNTLSKESSSVTTGTAPGNGGGGSVIATYWNLTEENYTSSAVDWDKRYWSLDTPSDGGMYFYLKGEFDYTVTLTANNGQTLSKDFTNTFVEVKPIGSSFSPMTFTVKTRTSRNGVAANTTILSGKFNRK